MTPEMPSNDIVVYSADVPLGFLAKLDDPSATPGPDAPVVEIRCQRVQYRPYESFGERLAAVVWGDTYVREKMPQQHQQGKQEDGRGQKSEKANNGYDMAAAVREGPATPTTITPGIKRRSSNSAEMDSRARKIARD